MNTPFRIVSVQLSSGPDIDANLGQAESIIARARSELGSISLCVLPENFCYFGPESERIAMAGTIYEKAQHFVKNQSIKNNCMVYGGGVACPGSDTKTLNRGILCDATGTVVAVYDKAHLFDAVIQGDSAYRESTYTLAGDDPGVLHTVNSDIILGMTICYDIRFPEIYRRLALRGATILLIPAAFTIPTGQAHWEVLLRARAIENTCYVVAAAQVTGEKSFRKTFGHSMCIGPWGDILDCLPDGTGYASCVVEPAVLADIRSRLPSLRHTRFLDSGPPTGS